MSFKINDWMEQYGAFLGWITLLMVLFTFVTVVSRNLFNMVWIPVQELAIYCHAIALMMGILYAWHHDRHVRVDLFYQNYSEQKKNTVNLIGTLLLMLPMMAFVIWSSWQYVGESWLRLEGSSETGGLPLVFIFKSLLLLMPVSVIAYVLLGFLKPSKQRKSN